MKLIIKLVSSAVLILAVCGCGGSGRFRAYEGKPVTSTETALLKLQWQTMGLCAALNTVDDRPARAARDLVTINAPREVEFLPGRHTVGVGYQYGADRSLEDLELSFDCEPARHAKQIGV